MTQQTLGRSAPDTMWFNLKNRLSHSLRVLFRMKQAFGGDKQSFVSRPLVWDRAVLGRWQSLVTNSWVPSPIRPELLTEGPPSLDSTRHDEHGPSLLDSSSKKRQDWSSKIPQGGSVVFSEMPVDFLFIGTKESQALFRVFTYTTLHFSKHIENSCRC